MKGVLFPEPREIRRLQGHSHLDGATVWLGPGAAPLEQQAAMVIAETLGTALGHAVPLREELPAASRLIGVRGVVLDMPIALGRLRFRFRRIKIAQGNLVGPGELGSELIAEVAVTHV